MNGSGTIAIIDSYNVSGIVDNGSGDFTITWDTDFANGNYAVLGTVQGPGTGGDYGIWTDSNNAPGTGSCRIRTGSSSHADASGATAAYDNPRISVLAIGDQS